MNDIMRGVLGGIADAHVENQKNLLSQEMDRRKSLAEFWQKRADDPNDRPEARDLALQKSLAIRQTPYDKKLPKGIEAIDDWLNVQPQKGQTIPQGPQQMFAPTEVERPPMETPGGPVQMPPMQLPGYSLEAPTPPPEFRVPHGYSQQERLNQAQTAQEAENTAALNLERQKTPILIGRAAAEEEAKNRIQYSPENIEGARRLKAAERGPVAVARDTVLYDPIENKIVARGDPKDLSESEQILDTAAQMVATRHGLQVAAAPGKTAFSQLPPEMQAEAVQTRARMDDRAGADELMKLQIQTERMQQQKMKQEMADLAESNDPKRFEGLADLVDQDPDTFFDFKGKEQSKVRDAMLAKGYRVPSKQLGAAQRTQDFNARLVLEHTAVIRDIIDKYPDIIGPIAGRVGPLEEDWGAPVFSFSKDPQRAQAEQELRTRLKYLNAQDLRALVGARPPHQWMLELKSASPNPRFNKNYMLGALDAVEGSAGLVLKVNDRLRYGTQPGAPPAPARPGAPAPPPGAGGGAGAGGAGGSTAAAAGAGANPLFKTKEQILKYANQVGIPYEEAKAAYKRDGFAVP